MKTLYYFGVFFLAAVTMWAMATICSEVWGVYLIGDNLGKVIFSFGHLMIGILLANAIFVLDAIKVRK